MSEQPPIYKAEFNAAEQSLIDKEFTRLADTTYLDHAGTTLYAQSQIADAAQQLQRDVICNPHTCRATGDYVDQVRYKILEFFNTNADDYHVVFTANATAALRLVADHFQFAPEAGTEAGNFYYCQENHTSVLGMRELVRERAAHIHVLSQAQLVDNDAKPASSASLANGNGNGKSNSLLVFSAQCNFSGYKMPLSLIPQIQSHGLSNSGQRIWSHAPAKTETNSKFYVCLDAASFVATNYLDLQRYRPDFVCVSFYKIFGYPTGVGALLVSKRGAAVLRKRFYGGGTVNYAYPHNLEHQLRGGFHERFEDGTLPFLSIVELLQGFRTLQRLVPASSSAATMERISRHVHGLARHCVSQLRLLRHPNGEPLITSYSHAGYEQREHQGGIVAFNVRTDSGGFVGFGEVACLAALQRILLRTGCFCNVGACQQHLELDAATMDAIYKRAGRVCGDYYDLLDGRPTGAVRVSFGYMTRLSDVQRVLQLLHGAYLRQRPQQRLLSIEAQVEQLPPVLKERVRQLRPRVLQLAIYPVKSCAAFKLPLGQRWPLTSQGLQHDRNWMIVDHNGLALTQKQCIQLCLLQPRIVQQQLELYYADDSFKLPLEQPLDALRCHSKVCRQPIEGYDCGDAVAAWLSQQLGIEGLRLLQQLRRDSRLSLANQAQFLLVNQASVRSLQFEEPLEETIDRFRANIVIDTQTPFSELAYASLSIGGHHFSVDGACQRCDMICINQRTGERSPETLTTIARMQAGKMRFGIYISLFKEPETDLSEELGQEEEEEMYLACGDAIEAASVEQ